MAEITNGFLRALGGYIVTHGTITTDKQAWSSTATWNDAGVTFTHLKANITNTASAAASKLIDLQVGGVTQFNVTRAGNGTLAGTLATGSYIGVGTTVGTGTNRLNLAVGDAIAWGNADKISVSAAVTTIKAGGGGGSIVLANASGGAMVTITNDTSAVAFAGPVSGITTLATSGVWTATSTGAHQISGVMQFVANATQQNGGICKESSSGLSLRAVTGATYDYAVTTPNGSDLLMGNPTGTVNLLFGGSLAVIGAATTQSGTRLSIGGTQQTTVGAAGGASALPATPSGYIKTFIGSTQFVIPYYAQA